MGKLMIIIILILLIGGYMIVRSYDLNLENKGDRKTFFKIFTGWLVKLGNNLKQLAANAVRQDWSPTNNTKNG